MGMITENFSEKSKLYVYEGAPSNVLRVPIDDDEILFWENATGDFYVVTEVVASGNTGKSIIFTNPDVFKNGFFVCRKPCINEINLLEKCREDKSLKINT